MNLNRKRKVKNKKKVGIELLEEIQERKGTAGMECELYIDHRKIKETAVKGHSRRTKTSRRYCYDKYCITRIIKDVKNIDGGKCLHSRKEYKKLGIEVGKNDEKRGG